ncbi:hypothetical protein NM688_g6309 [Phlebia brevispora]|uniref:Uncharacterized protein n=1 Tax=Phlebia brevispora TaxID=194682 RepID=A0ACC1SHM8_9APHY|nr:hypothetical protein NM688_g6309 [Phlebia brevispora]
MSPTPWSWQKPPLPESYSVPRYTYSVPPSKIWNRSLWGMEPYYALCSYYQPGFTDVLCSCQLSAQSASNDKVLSLNTLRAAICLLRHQRPNIASRLAFSALASGQPPCEKDVHLVYETVTAEEEIERWVSEVVRDRSAVFDDAGSMQSAVDHVMREVGSGFSSLPTTLFNVYYIVAPDRREAALVVRGSHVVFDAFGLTTCLNQLIANMALIVGNSRDVEELVWGEEVGRLVGPGIEYATIPWSPEQAEEDKAMLRRAVEVAKGVKVGTLLDLTILTNIHIAYSRQVALPFNTHRQRQPQRPFLCAHCPQIPCVAS